MKMPLSCVTACSIPVRMNVSDDVPLHLNSDDENKRKLVIGRLSGGNWLEH